MSAKPDVNKIVQTVFTEFDIKDIDINIKTFIQRIKPVIRQYEDIQGIPLTSEEIKAVIENLLEEQIDAIQVQKNIARMSALSGELEGLHRELISNPSIAALNKWNADIISLYMRTNDARVLYDEAEVTTIKADLTEVPAQINTDRWTALRLQRMQASANLNDCLLHSFLTCVCPIFRRTLRKTEGTLKIRGTRLGDVIAGMFRRNILPELVSADINKASAKAKTDRNRGYLLAKQNRLIEDVVGDGAISDELIGILSRSFNIVIFLRDRPEDVRAAAGFANGLLGDIGRNGWAGMDTEVPSNEFIILFNPGRGHYEPVRAAANDTYIFDYQIINQRYPRVSAALAAPAEPAALAYKKNRDEKALIATQLELEDVEVELEKLKKREKSSNKSIVRRPLLKKIADLEEQKRILVVILEQMKGGAKRKRNHKTRKQNKKRTRLTLKR